MPRGVPQIEISYDLDANGILNVSACEKSSGKSDSIKVTNDKGRLSKEDIDKMLADAERFKEDDEKAKQTIEARNNYENLVYQFKGTLNDEKIASQIDESLKEKLTNIITENVKWLEHNQNASKEEYEYRLKNFQEEMKPLQEKMMSGQGVPADFSKYAQASEPDIADID
jgi:L1 cell adhesion molecule like protein